MPGELVVEFIFMERKRERNGFLPSAITFHFNFFFGFFVLFVQMLKTTCDGRWTMESIVHLISFIFDPTEMLNHLICQDVRRPAGLLVDRSIA